MIAHYCWLRHGKISGGRTLAKVLACGLMLSCVVAAGQDALLENALTAEEAKRAIARDDYVHIVAAELSEGAAEVLGTFSGGLRLVLGNLSMPVAERLAKHRGEMSIEVTRTLPDTVIAALQEHRGELCVTTPRQRCYSSKADDEDAASSPPGSPPNKESSPTRGKASPAAITPTTTPVAHATDQTASGANTLTVEQARDLLKKGDRELRLDGPTSLSPEAAGVLATHPGRLNLNSLTSLSEETAKALAKHTGGALSLNRLPELSVEAAAALAKHKGGKSQSGLGALDQLMLGGLTEMSDEVAAALSKHKGYELSLPRLTTISDEGLRALAQHEQALDLRGLKVLSDEGAKALALHADLLNLEGVTTLSDAAARSLSQHQGGELMLFGVKQLSPEAAAALRANPEILLPEKFTQ